MRLWVVGFDYNLDRHHTGLEICKCRLIVQVDRSRRLKRPRKGNNHPKFVLIRNCYCYCTKIVLFVLELSRWLSRVILSLNIEFGVELWGGKTLIRIDQYFGINWYRPLFLRNQLNSYLFKFLMNVLKYEDNQCDFCFKKYSLTV